MHCFFIFTKTSESVVKLNELYFQFKCQLMAVSALIHDCYAQLWCAYFKWKKKRVIDPLWKQ